MKERALAFNPELEGKSTDQALYDDLVSYLGEYRLRVPKYSYCLNFGGSSFDDLHVRNIYNNEPAAESAKRAIEEKQSKGLPTHREEAELFALNGLSNQLQNAYDGDTVIWASPPGPSEEGYGNYGFLFTGKYHKKDSINGNLEMTAVRIENPDLVQYNSALRELTGMPISFTQTDAILAHPFVVRGNLEESQLDTILRKHFQFNANEEDQRIFGQVIRDLEPNIHEFIHLTKIKSASKDEKLSALHALEHYALELKEHYKGRKAERVLFVNDYRSHLPLEQLVRVYQDKELPQVAGSCGSSGDLESNSPLSFGFKNLLKAIFGENATDYKDDPNLCRCGGLEPHFHCPGVKKISENQEVPCRKPIIVGQGTTQCSSCGAGKVC